MKNKLMIILALALALCLCACTAQEAAESPLPSQESTDAPASQEEEDPQEESQAPTEVPDQPVYTPVIEPENAPGADPSQDESYEGPYFEMYIQHYDEAGNVIEIPQITGTDSEGAESINQALRELGDEYYSEYIDGFTGNRTCQVIAYPCITDDYLCVLLNVKELPDTRTGGEVYSWIYDIETGAELAIDYTIAQEAIDLALTDNMTYTGLGTSAVRITQRGDTVYYANFNYTIGDMEYASIFADYGEGFVMCDSNNMVPSLSVVHLDEELWCRQIENNNYAYDTTETQEEIDAIGEELKTLVIKERDLLLTPEQMTALYLQTCLIEVDGEHQRCLAFQVWGGTSTIYGLYIYQPDSEGFYAYNGESVTELTK